MGECVQARSSVCVLMLLFRFVLFGLTLFLFLRTTNMRRSFPHDKVVSSSV